MSETGQYTAAFLKSKLPEDEAGRRSELASLAKKMDITVKQLQYILRNERTPSPKTAELLASLYHLDHFGMLAEGRRILRGEPKAPAQPSPQSAELRIVPAADVQIPEGGKLLTDYFAAPLIPGTIAAGAGLTLGEEEIESFVWIYAPELRDRRTHRLRAVKIDERDGRSMEPTLLPGDIVLFDMDDPQSTSAFEDGRLYAVRTDPWEPYTAVKRVYRRKKENVVLIGSDNPSPKYGPQVAWTNELKKLIIGRIVWGWRDLLRA